MDLTNLRVAPCFVRFLDETCIVWVYGVPTANIEENTELLGLIQAVSTLNEELVVVRDFKISDINWGTEVSRRELQMNQSYNGCFYLA